ncbi:unnamed protein product, partial [Ostreobium quekettii]
FPVIITGSEDGTVKIWHSTTFRLEDTLNEGKERVWSIGHLKGSNSIAVGYDEGVLLLKLGRDEPLVSMDSSGKIIWARHNEIQTTNLKSLPSDAASADGERLPLPVKDLGSSDLYPQSLSHNPNGRFVAVCGDGEYIVYTALAWRNKSFGSADEFVWGNEASEFATREGRSKVKVSRNFQEKHTLKPQFVVEGLFGGTLLGLRGSDFVAFYDWAEGTIVRRIDVPVKKVFWSDSGDYLAITADDAFYILEFRRELVDAVLNSGQDVDEDGIEDAFEVVSEVSEQVVTALWVGDCFLYNNSSWRLNYFVGGEVTTLYHLDRPMYLLGFLASQSRVYLIDKDLSVVSYTLLMNLIEYKTLVMRGDIDAAQEILETLPEDQLNNVAKFLESRDLVKEALEVATDPDYRFDLAVQLGDLPVAHQIADQVNSEVKWKQLGELAMTSGKLTLAEDCLMRGKDLPGLLLLFTARGSKSSLKELIPLAKEQGCSNIAFMAHFLLGNLDACIQLLVDTGRMPEAAFFARTYAPSKMSMVVEQWRDDLKKINPKAADSLADPAKYPNLFPHLDMALKAEEIAQQRRLHPVPASEYPQHEGSNTVNLIEEIERLAIGERTGAVENGDIPPHAGAEPIPASGDEAGISVARAAGSLSTQEGTTQIGQRPHAAVDDGSLVESAAGAEHDWGLEDGGQE